MATLQASTRLPGRLANTRGSPATFLRSAAPKQTRSVRCLAQLNAPVARIGRPSRSRQVVCRASASDLPVNTDTLGADAGLVRTVAFLSFWVQLPLTVVSAGILLFAVQFSQQPSDITRWFTTIGVAVSFISTFFAEGFLRLARKAVDRGEAVKRSFFLQNLVRNVNINLFGIGITLIGLQAAVGTLVTKAMLGATNAPYAAPAPGSTLISLDVYTLQASTNTLLAHFLSIVFANIIIGIVNRVGASPQAQAA